MCREFLCLSKVLPCPGTILDHSPLALPSVHHYYELMRQTYYLCSPQLCRSCALSLCRLLQAPADIRLFPALSLSIFQWMSDPIPRCSLKCDFSFLPSKHRPSPAEEWVGKLQYSVQQLQYGGSFRGCRYSLLFRPPLLLPPWLLALYVLHKRPVTFTSEQNTDRYLTVHRIC
jgi:hypothetical protein